MRQLRTDALKIMIGAFTRLECQVPPPRWVSVSGTPHPRYTERTPEQAIIQKLARYLTGLQAAEWLNANGWLQEQAVIQRTLDELDEDVAFIVHGLRLGFNKIHRKFLKRFWQEEFDEDVSPMESTAKRYLVSRADIRNWLLDKTGFPTDGKEAKAVEIIQQVYSGYVHAASPQIMEMCHGNPPKFSVTGLAGTPLQLVHEDDLFNYSFRGLLMFQIATRAFGDEWLNDQLNEFRDNFETASGTHYKNHDATTFEPG